MQLTQDTTGGRYYIRAYGPGKIKINDLIITHSVIITPEELIDPWPPQTVNELMVEHFDPIIRIKPEILLLGSGAALQFPDPQLFAKLYAAKIGVEVMDTGAACRTFNVLSSEGRNVAAALVVNT